MIRKIFRILLHPLSLFITGLLVALHQVIVWGHIADLNQIAEWGIHHESFVMALWFGMLVSLFWRYFSKEKGDHRRWA